MPKSLISGDWWWEDTHDTLKSSLSYSSTWPRPKVCIWGCLCISSDPIKYCINGARGYSVYRFLSLLQKWTLRIWDEIPVIASNVNIWGYEMRCRQKNLQVIWLQIINVSCIKCWKYKNQRLKTAHLCKFTQGEIKDCICSLKRALSLIHTNKQALSYLF